MSILEVFKRVVVRISLFRFDCVSD